MALQVYCLWVSINPSLGEKDLRNPLLLGYGVAVTRRTLTPLSQVRILVAQPKCWRPGNPHFLPSLHHRYGDVKPMRENLSSRPKKAHS